MKYRHIGDVRVSAIGLGAQNLSVAGRPDRDVATATIHAALDAGITLFDTSDAYTTEAEGQGHNELLIVEALASYPGDTNDVLVSSKGGLFFRDGRKWDRIGNAEYLKKAAKDSAHRLGVDAIGLYHLHRPDPEIEIEESIGALRDLLDEGVIRMVGLSNVDVAQIELANRMLGGRLASVENQFSPVAQESRPELEYCDAHGIAYLLWGPLGGTGVAQRLAGSLPGFERVAEERGVSIQRVVLAWELAQSGTTLPIPGAVKPAEVEDSALAADLDLTGDELALLGATSQQAQAPA